MKWISSTRKHTSNFHKSEAGSALSLYKHEHNKMNEFIFSKVP